MIKRKNSDGWTETTTVTHKIKMITKNPFLPLNKWLEFHQKHPQLKSLDRTNCNCCDQSFKTLQSDVFLAMMEKGPNRVICENCRNFFAEQNTGILINNKTFDSNDSENN